MRKIELLVDELVGNKAAAEQAQFRQIRAKLSSQFKSDVEKLMSLTSARNIEQS